MQPQIAFAYAPPVAAPAPKPRSTQRPPSALRGFVTMVWRQALVAVPMALFFGTPENPHAPTWSGQPRNVAAGGRGPELRVGIAFPGPPGRDDRGAPSQEFPRRCRGDRVSGSSLRLRRLRREDVRAASRHRQGNESDRPAVAREPAGRTGPDRPARGERQRGDLEALGCRPAGAAPGHARVLPWRRVRISDRLDARPGSAHRDADSTTWGGRRSPRARTRCCARAWCSPVPIGAPRRVRTAF